LLGKVTMSVAVGLLLAALLGAGASAIASRPNILFILLDDLGFNDLSYHGGSEFLTPVMDRMAEDALILNQYYVQHFCTPTRHALMSGRYPMRDGLQQWVIRSSSPYGMPLEITTLPENLKNGGYKNHLLGKWHLGFFDPAYTPTNRGFDTFYGYYGDKEDYYEKNNSEWAVISKQALLNNHLTDDALYELSGRDFRDGITPWVTKEYSTYFYGNRTINRMRKKVEEQDPDPFFILLSSQAPHTPYDAPQDVLDHYSAIIDDENRYKYAAVLSVLDHSLGDIMDYMQSEESGYIWDDTMVIVSADNGGSVTEGASNFPLRGGKKTLWEGGIRATAFITGGWLPEGRRGQEMNALMHVTDWLPTLCSIAGVDPAGDLELDGYDQSDNILIGESDIYYPREEILHHVIMHDQTEDDGFSSSCYDDMCGAIRWRDYKLVVGRDTTMSWSDDEHTNCLNTWCEIAVPKGALSSHSVQCSDERNNYKYPLLSEHSCLFSGAACLFNVYKDACEWNDILSSKEDIYEMLLDKLKVYNASQAWPMFREYPENATMANPSQFGGFWSPWIHQGAWKVVDEVTIGYWTPKPPDHDNERRSETELVADSVKVQLKGATYHTLICASAIAVCLLAAAAILQLCHNRTSKRSDYHQIGDHRNVDMIRISV